MSHQLLATIGLLTASEAALSDAPEVAVKRIKAMQDAAAPGDAKDKRIKDLEDEIQKLKDADSQRIEAAQTAAKTRATSLVEAAVTDGRIAAQDEATKTKFIEAISSGNTFAEEQLAGLGNKLNPGGPVVRVQASDAPATNNTRRIEAAQGKARTELGAGADFNTVWARAQEIDPAAFND